MVPPAAMILPSALPPPSIWLCCSSNASHETRQFELSIGTIGRVRITRCQEITAFQSFELAIAMRCRCDGDVGSLSYVFAWPLSRPLTNMKTRLSWEGAGAENLPLWPQHSSGLLNCQHRGSDDISNRLFWIGQRRLHSSPGWCVTFCHPCVPHAIQCPQICQVGNEDLDFSMRRFIRTTFAAVYRSSRALRELALRCRHRAFPPAPGLLSMPSVVDGCFGISLSHAQAFDLHKKKL